MDDVLFTNIRLDQDTHYFLYIGEIKAYGINAFLREALARKFNSNVDFLAIIPDVMQTYHVNNVMVVNPAAEKLAQEMGKPVNCRISAAAFASEVSRHRPVIALLERLLDNQQEVEIYQFESLPGFTLDRIPGVRIIGPDKDLSRQWNNKVYQHEALKDVVPLVDFRVCDGIGDTEEAIGQLIRVWKDGLYVNLEYGAAGSNSCILLPHENAVEKFKTTFQDFNGRFLLSKFIPHEYDPTVLAVVANAQDVAIGGVADQHMEDFNKFRGSSFPSVLTDTFVARLKAYTKAVGRRMGITGYRGIFGCDFLVDQKGDIFFLEVNARKQGTTMEMSCTAENSLPTGSPSLPEMEYYAVTENRFPLNTAEQEGNPGHIHWGTYNYKLDQDILTKGGVAPPEDERAIFEGIAGSPSAREAFCVVDHIGKGCIVKSGSFLGRVISVATTHDGVKRGLDRGKHVIKKTVGEVISHE